MKKHLFRAGFAWTIIILVTISFSFSAMAGDKRKFVYIAKGEKPSTVTNLHDPNDLKNKITQWSGSTIIVEHSDPSLVGSEQTMYGQSNFSAYMDKDAKGFSWGYTISKSKEGDCIYSKWDSTWSVTTLAHADWMVNEEVKFQIIGGTGKYSSAKGTGSCQSKRTPKGRNVKCEGELEF